MVKVHTNDGVGTGEKRVLPVEWQEAVPFALKLEERWRQPSPAIPERIRYVRVELGLPDPPEPGFGRAGQSRSTEDGGNRVIIPAFPPDLGEDD